MKIIKNESVFRSRDIAKIVLRAIKDQMPKEKLGRYRVYVEKSRRRKERNSTHGCAPVGGFHMRLWLHSGWTTPEKLAAVALHEAQHSVGAQHRGMTDRVLWCRTEDMEGDSYFPWAVAMPLRQKEIKTKKPVTGLEERKAVQAALARWERKAKLAATKLAGYRARLAQLQKKEGIAFAASPTGATRAKPTTRRKTEVRAKTNKKAAPKVARRVEARAECATDPQAQVRTDRIDAQKEDTAGKVIWMIRRGRQQKYRRAAIERVSDSTVSEWFAVQAASPDHARELLNRWPVMATFNGARIIDHGTGPRKGDRHEGT
jgi:hypothetical protein